MALVLGIHIDKSVLERMMHYKDPFNAFSMGGNFNVISLFQRQKNETWI